jgi:hypothetical protein
MLAFCVAPEALRERILQLFDGGGPAQWPKVKADSDTFPCVPTRASCALRAHRTENCITRVLRAAAGGGRTR